MSPRQRQDLDDYITGHYGEDQFQEEENEMCQSQVISERVISQDSRRTFGTMLELVTHAKPTREEIIESQERLGFRVAGYGGPADVISAEQPDGAWTTTWRCYGSCD